MALVGPAPADRRRRRAPRLGGRAVRRALVGSPRSHRTRADRARAPLSAPGRPGSSIEATSGAAASRLDLRILAVSSLVPLLGKRRAPAGAAPAAQEGRVRVLVNGAGNIGTTLANLLLAHRAALGIREVVVRKVREAQRLRTTGAASSSPSAGRGWCARRPRRRRATCSSRSTTCSTAAGPGAALRDRDVYLGASQPARRLGPGQRDRLRRPLRRRHQPRRGDRAQRLVQIASCNTHATATLLRVLGGAAARAPGGGRPGLCPPLRGPGQPRAHGRRQRGEPPPRPASTARITPPTRRASTPPSGSPRR